MQQSVLKQSLWKPVAPLACRSQEQEGLVVDLIIHHGHLPNNPHSSSHLETRSISNNFNSRQAPPPGRILGQTGVAQSFPVERPPMLAPLGAVHLSLSLELISSKGGDRLSNHPGVRQCPIRFRTAKAARGHRLERHRAVLAHLAAFLVVQQRVMVLWGQLLVVKSLLLTRDFSKLLSRRCP